MKIGDSMFLEPQSFYDAPYTTADKKHEKSFPMYCEVVYIHPEERYCTVAFPVKNGNEIRESFMMLDGRVFHPQDGRPVGTAELNGRGYHKSHGKRV